MQAKVAIITASSTGIGLAIAISLGKQGCRVVISSRKQKNVDEAIEKLKSIGIEGCFGVTCHVGKKQDRLNLIKMTIQRFGRIDYLVPNAAITTQLGPMLQADEKALKKMWQVNYFSVFLLIQEALPYLKQNEGSAILITSSFVIYQSKPQYGQYALTKLGLAALIKHCAKSLQRHGIRVNGVAPGLIKTEFSGRLWRNREQIMIKSEGVKRLGKPQDVGELAAFLLSPKAEFINGQNIIIAGKAVSRL